MVLLADRGQDLPVQVLLLYLEALPSVLVDCVPLEVVLLDVFLEFVGVRVVMLQKVLFFLLLGHPIQQVFRLRHLVTLGLVLMNHERLVSLEVLSHDLVAGSEPVKAIKVLLSELIGLALVLLVLLLLLFLDDHCLLAVLN